MTPAAPHSGRLERLRAFLRRGSPGALLVTHLPNVRWLCGFTGSAGTLLVTRREAVFFTDSRYRFQAAREVRVARRIERTGSLWKAVAAEVRRSRVRSLGFEADRLTVAARDDLAAFLDEVRLAPFRGTVEALRAVKDPGEVAAIRRSLAVARTAFLAATRTLRGRREVDVAEALRSGLWRAGGEGECFPSIVASGHRGALPHAKPSSRRIRPGDLVVVDFGAVRAGYCSDVTRTLGPGKWGAKARLLYRTVLEAQNAALSAVRPGVQASSVDIAARRVIERAGFGEAFGHGTGHGVGLEVHESPSISLKSGDVLRSGMVFTVEPGIYLEDFGGVRIEDMVLVSKIGCTVLSRGVPKLEGH